MTELTIRRINFEIAADAPFAWQPDNPAFAAFCNLFSFIAVPFEKYIVQVMRAAKDQTEDPEVLAEMDGFLRQEAQHANAHRRHIQVLVDQYPGLQRCYDDACASYDELLKTESLNFNLAYIANLEATFTPLFKMVLDNRESLFGRGDPTIASMMMWHFVEEIEHRSSGLLICEAIVGSKFFRLKSFKETFDHVGTVARSIRKSFDEHVPAEDRKVSVAAISRSRSAMFGPRLPWQPKASNEPVMLKDVSNIALIKMMYRLTLSQLPFHNPAHQPLPSWAKVWLDSYDQGDDMARFWSASDVPPHLSR